MISELVLKIVKYNISVYLCYQSDSTIFINPTTTDTEGVCEEENSRRAAGEQGEQQHCSRLRYEGVDPEQENRRYRRPAGRSEL